MRWLNDLWSAAKVGFFSCLVTIGIAQPLPTAVAVIQGFGHVWEEKPLLAAAAVALPACIALDRPLTELWEQSPVADVLFGAARLYGERWTPVLLAVGLYGIGWAAGEEQLRRAGLTVAGATLLTTAVIMGIKVAVGRARPFLGQGSWLFRPPAWHDAYQSFPSGHTAVAATLSAAVSSSLSLPPVASGALYVVTALTALSRIYHRAHWFSDVLAGALIGYASGQAVAQAFTPKKRAEHWSILPTVGGVSVKVPLR